MGKYRKLRVSLDWHTSTTSEYSINKEEEKISKCANFKNENIF